MTKTLSDKWEQGTRLLRIVRLQPYDTVTEEGRSLERYRRLALNTGSAIAAKLLTILGMLISIPLTLSYLGQERYGLWMVITSLLTFLTFTDLGITYGLQNAISEADGRDDRAMAQQYISSSLMMLIILGGCGAVVFALLFPFVSWAKLFGVTSPIAVAEAGPAMAAFVICFALYLPLNIVTRVQLGYQKSTQNNLWQCVGSLASLIGLFLVIRIHGGLPLLVLTMAGIPLLATLINGFVFFGIQSPWLRPTVSHVRLPIIRSLFHVGIQFFLAQVIFAFAYYSDNFVITRVLGPVAVANYAVCIRLFGLAAIPVSMFSLSLWPAYGEAHARGDVAWQKRTLWKALRLSLVVTSLMSAFLLLMGRWIIMKWTHGVFVPGVLLLAGIGVWTVLDSIRTTLSVFLNAANVLKFQTAILSLYAVVSLVSKVVFARSFHLEGIVWAGSFSFLAVAVLPYLWYTRRYINAQTDKAAPVEGTSAA